MGGRRSDLAILARGSALALGGMLIGAAGGLALLVVLARALGAAATGLFFVSVAIFSILTNACELGADTGLVRAVSRDRAIGQVERIRPTLIAALTPVGAVALVVAAAAVVFAPNLARHLADEGGEQVAVGYLRGTAIFIPAAAVMSVAIAATRGFDRILPFVAIQNVLVALSRPLLVLGALAMGLGSLAVAVAWGLPLAVGCSAACIVLVRLARRATARSRVHGAPPPRARDVASGFWRFSAPRGLAGLLQIGMVWIDIVLLGLLRPDAEVGVYAIVSRTVVAGTLVLQAVRIAIAPRIGRHLAIGDRRAAQLVLSAATTWQMAVSWPILLCLAVFASTVLGVYGPGFEVGESSLAELALAMLIDTGTGNVSTVLLMGGKSSWNLANTAAAVTLNVALSLVLIPRFGILGAAYAWALSIVVENAAACVEVEILLHLRTFSSSSAFVGATSLVCIGGVGLATRALGGTSLAATLGAVLIGGGAYVLALWRRRTRLLLPDFREVLGGGAQIEP